MKKNIESYINAIIADNTQCIIEGGYDSVADYLISNADNSDQGWYEYFSDEEKEFGLSDEQIEEARDYIKENYSLDFNDKK